MKTIAIYFLNVLTLIVFLFRTESIAQRIRLHGTVLNESTSEPVPYATIQILNTFQGTSTNELGEFSLLVNKKDSLKISSIGYESTTVSVSTDNITIALKANTKVLEDVTVFSETINVRKLVKRAFRRIKKNYISEPVTMNTFYRHYCKDDSVYGRLIEAAVEVYKAKGYRKPKDVAYKKDYRRLIQVRRSFDKTFIQNRHVPIAFDDIMSSDMMSYQNHESDGGIPAIFLRAPANALKANLKDYVFELDGLTYLNGKEVYVISYKIGNVPETLSTGIKLEINHSGRFFITDDNYAIVKIEDDFIVGNSQTTKQIFYIESGDKYYLSHIIHEGVNRIRTDSSKYNHTANIEILVNDILPGKRKDFEDEPITERVLSTTKYDQISWDNYTTISENPLEKNIKQQLEKEQSLEAQYEEKSALDYKNYEQLVLDNETMQALLTSNKDEIVYVDFWASWCSPCISEFIRSKQIVENYSDKGIRFVYVSIDKEAKNGNKIKTRLWAGYSRTFKNWK